MLFYVNDNFSVVAEIVAIFQCLRPKAVTF